MRVIGLCGRSGSGKSVFCQVAAENGFYIIDCDELYHNLTSKPTSCLLELEEYFGSEIIENNRLNRKKLANIVFNDKEKLKKLNQITHKHILAEISRRIEEINNENEDAFIVLDAPTLFESGVQFLCDGILLMSAPEDACINRIVSRDNITKEQAVARLSNQLSVEFLASRANIQIINDSNLEDLKKDCLAAIQYIKEKI